MNIQEVTSSSKWGGKNGDTLTVEYLISGTADRVRAYIEFCCYIQSRFRKREGLFLQTMDVEIKPNAYDFWTGKATWSTNDRERAIWSGSTQGDTINIKQSKNTVDWGPAWENLDAPDLAFIVPTPNFNRAINVDKDEVKGCEILIPKWEHNVKISYRGDLLSANYFSALHRMTGTVNNAPVWFFRKGEVLFKGADWTTKYERDHLGNLVQWFTFTFYFTAEPNVDIKVIDKGPRSTVHKEGQQYIWFYYETQKDEKAKILVPKPTTAYVEQVYDYSDFSFFGFDGPYYEF